MLVAARCSKRGSLHCCQHGLIFVLTMVFASAKFLHEAGWPRNRSDELPASDDMSVSLRNNDRLQVGTQERSNTARFTS